MYWFGYLFVSASDEKQKILAEEEAALNQFKEQKSGK